MGEKGFRKRSEQEVGGRGGNEVYLLKLSTSTSKLNPLLEYFYKMFALSSLLLSSFLPSFILTFLPSLCASFCPFLFSYVFATLCIFFTVTFNILVYFIANISRFKVLLPLEDRYTQYTLWLTEGV